VREAGISQRILILGDGDGVHYGHVTVGNLMTRSLGTSLTIGRKLEPGESRRKIAFLCASSGTTGKFSCISFAFIFGFDQVFQENPK
jgi:hypothetical protein